MSEPDFFLKQRYIPQTPQGLSERTLRRARQTPSFGQELLMMLMLPKPSYLLAASLVFSVSLGIFLGGNVEADPLSYQDILLYMNEGWL